MEILSLLRTIGALGLVLGMLAGALWAVRRYDIKLPGRVTSGSRRRIEMVERLSIDAKRSVALIRRDNAEHLILIAPDGHLTIETGIVRPDPVIEEPAAPARAAAVTTVGAPAAPVPVPSAPNDNLVDVRQGFGMLVEQARARLKVAGARA